MEKLVIILLDLGLLSVYTIAGIVGALLIQGIVYQLTGFSIYRWLDKKLFKEIY